MTYVSGDGDTEEDRLTNRPETKSFLETALTWHGSITPKVLPRVVITAIYGLIVALAAGVVPEIALPITPFEYSGAVLALILVMRVNAGHERWWEARKIWGTIVNQSRNLALVVACYGAKRGEKASELLGLIAAWPHIMRLSLRWERDISVVSHLIGPADFAALQKSDHMPLYIGYRIASILHSLRGEHLDAESFLRAETERSMLIDAIGACERIRNTRMPFALAVKTRRFILLFLALLPFALIERVGLATPLVMALASYPLFSLDEIGAELQNPFSPRNVSHLPLKEICHTIERNVMSLKLALVDYIQ